jgi:hypothetical protein
MSELSPIRQQTFKNIDRCLKGAGEQGLSIQEVAKCLEFKGASPMITEMLNGLVAANFARKEWEIIRTGRTHRMGWRYYSITDSELTF